jgi:hypothetical protein
VAVTTESITAAAALSRPRRKVWKQDLKKVCDARWVAAHTCESRSTGQRPHTKEHIMTNIDYITDRYNRRGRQFAEYPSPHPATSYPATPAAPKSLHGAALAAVLMATIGVSAAIGAYFYHADSSPVPPTSIVLPGSVASPATPQAPGVASPVIVEQAPAGVAPTWTVQPATISNQPPPPPPNDNTQTPADVMPIYIPTKQITPPGPCAFAGANCGDQAQSNGDDGSTPSDVPTPLPDNSDPKPATNGAASTPFPEGGLQKPNQVTLPNGGEANLPTPGKASSPNLGKDFVSNLSPKDLQQALN